MLKRAKRKKPKNISPETGVVLEYFEDQVKVIAEHVLSIDKKTNRIVGIETKVDTISDKMDGVGEVIKIIKASMMVMKTDMKLTKEDIETIKDDLKAMKMDMELVKYGFKKKVDIDEFAALEKRVSTLENRL